MSDTHKQVFAAIEALPRPITAEQALREGLAIIQDSKAKQQWQAWMLTNGAQLVAMINRGQ